MGQHIASIKSQIVDGTNVSIRYTSGQTIYEEALTDSRWISRSWSPKGMIDLNPPIHGELYFNSSFTFELDGQSLHRGWKYIASEEIPVLTEGHKHSIVTLHNEIRPIGVHIHTYLDGTSILTRWLEIENMGDAPAALSSLWVWQGRLFPLQSGDLYYDQESNYRSVSGPYSIGYFTENKHMTEGHFQWKNVGSEMLEIGEKTGKSGWGHPLVYVRDESAGAIFLLQLAWSGGWKIQIEPQEPHLWYTEHQNRLLFARVGPFAAAPMRVIEPYERISTPQIHIGCAQGDLTSMVHELHEHQRKSVLLPPPPNCAHLISYNHFGYTTHEISEEKLRNEINIAYDIGADVFTIDAGWYGNTGVDWKETGNWHPGDRLPNGLDSTFSYAREKGMKCGLWCWIEAAGLESNIVKLHPEWLLERDGKRLNNLLDLSKPEVAAYVETEICRIVEDYKLDLFRIDYNEFPLEGGYNRRKGFDENTIWRHYEALYKIWSRVRERYPHLIIENCAAGGARTDLGMLSHTHYTWYSDYILVPRAVRMLNAMLMALPPEALAKYFGIVMNGHLGGDLDMQLRLNFLVGNPALSGIWPSHEEAHSYVRDRIHHVIRLFKKHIKPMINTSRVYHHTPEISGNNPEGWCILEYGDPNQSKSVMGIFRLAGEGEKERIVRFRGLTRSQLYRVWFDNRNEWVDYSGKELIDQGIRILLASPMQSELLIAETY